MENLGCQKIVLKIKKIYSKEHLHWKVLFVMHFFRKEANCAV